MGNLSSHCEKYDGSKKTGEDYLYLYRLLIGITCSLGFMIILAGLGAFFVNKYPSYGSTLFGVFWLIMVALIVGLGGATMLHDSLMCSHEKYPCTLSCPPPSPTCCPCKNDSPPK